MNELLAEGEMYEGMSTIAESIKLTVEPVNSVEPAQDGNT